MTAHPVFDAAVQMFQRMITRATRQPYFPMRKDKDQSERKMDIVVLVQIRKFVEKRFVNRKSYRSEVVLSQYINRLGKLRAGFGSVAIRRSVILKTPSEQSDP
ncbi:hypothetical protein JOE11_004954 [Robbsia andropogonis]|uniref:hypothetical protein n=1 Tax=Robbsia andropogonis TaxID=28092 RepID=UPI003D22A2E0